MVPTFGVRVEPIREKFRTRASGLIGRLHARMDVTAATLHPMFFALLQGGSGRLIATRRSLIQIIHSRFLKPILAAIRAVCDF